MKNHIYIWLAITTLALLIVAVWSYLDPLHPYLWVVWVVAFILFLITVFKVLQEKRSSKKTFYNWYEDDPRE